MNNKYFMSTGENDRQRLTILSSLYNPTAIYFLKKNGLKEGMTVLEVGCGTGHMACELARCVGTAGKVVAIDHSPDQIKIAKGTAESANISNIEFHVCDVFDIDKLHTSYDVTYGRWTIEFTQDPEKALKIMHENLKPGGLLAYEATNSKQTAFFAHPPNPIIEQWHTISSRLFEKNGCDSKFASRIFTLFKSLGCKNIDELAVQALLKTPTEKSVYRLGLLSAKSAILENKIATEQEFAQLYQQFSDFENSESISGFFQNFLISGIK